MAVAGSVLAGADGLEAELQQQQIEIGTEPCESLAELAEQLRHWRSEAAAAAERAGALIVATGTSPVPVVPELTVKPRYRAMVETFGLTTAEQLTCGCHVHVGVDSAEEGVAVLDRIRVWLPVILALTANSPVLAGRRQRLRELPVPGLDPVAHRRADRRVRLGRALSRGGRAAAADRGRCWISA